MNDNRTDQTQDEALVTRQSDGISLDEPPVRASDTKGMSPLDPDETRKKRPDEMKSPNTAPPKEDQDDTSGNGTGKEYHLTRKIDDPDFDEGEPRWGTARFSPRMILEIKLCGKDGKQGRMTFTYDNAREIIMGRQDPKIGFNPQISLESFGAHKQGVSRRHASITRRDGGLDLTDLGSSNGTYLNGQRLIANQPRVLRDGDEVRLGYLVLCVHFREVH